MDTAVSASRWSAAADAYDAWFDRPWGRHATAVEHRLLLDAAGDINAVDVGAEAERLTRLGAQRTASDICHEHGSSWIVMTDPEGNEFCVCDGGNPTDPNAEGDR
jgi:hypothetical protein